MEEITENFSHLSLRVSPYPSRQPTKNPKLEFLDLPSEIRNLIYKFALTAPGPLECTGLGLLTHSYSTPPYHRHKEPPYPLLLQTNKIVNMEAKPALYGANTFSFENVRRCLTFLGRLEPCDLDFVNCIFLKQVPYMGAYKDWAEVAWMLTSTAKRRASFGALHIRFEMMVSVKEVGRKEMVRVQVQPDRSERQLQVLPRLHGKPGYSRWSAMCAGCEGCEGTLGDQVEAGLVLESRPMIWKMGSIQEFESLSGGALADLRDGRPEVGVCIWRLKHPV